MKIVNRGIFMSLPENTLFSKYEPCCFEHLHIKGDNCGSDFLAQQINDAIECNDSGEFTDKLDDAMANDTSVDMDFDCMGRDGCFDEDQLFAVWEPPDVKNLIARLRQCLPKNDREETP